MSKAGETILRGAREALDYARGERGNEFVAHVPEEVDVKAIRNKMRLSQAKFANSFGFSINAIKNWEQGRRHPDVAARAFLTVIAKETNAVLRALCSEYTIQQSKAKRRRRAA
jgi:putative transcriptional regulator